jgi:hypothetical protein
MKPPTIILVASIVLGSAALTYLYLQIGQTQESLQQEVTKSGAHAVELGAKIADSSAQIESLKKDLSTQTANLTDTNATLSATDNRVGQLGRDQTQVRAQVVALVDAQRVISVEVTQIKPEIAELKVAAAAVTPDMLAGLTTTTTALQSKVAELEAALAKAAARAKGPAVVSEGGPLTAEAASSVLKAGGARFDVLSVGNKNAFVVVQAGAAQELQVGQHFVISRNGSGVAEAVVSSIHEKCTIAQIIPSSLKGALNKGDVAIVAQ